MELSVQAQSIDLKPVEEFLNTQLLRWQAEHPNAGGWAILTGKVSIREVVRFIIECTDEFVVMVGGMVGSTGDVKEIVKNCVTMLYDNIIAGVLPIWLKPFSGTIKWVIIDVIVDNLIDYLVEQYKTGARVAMHVEQAEMGQRF